MKQSASRQLGPPGVEHLAHAKSKRHALTFITAVQDRAIQAGVAPVLNNKGQGPCYLPIKVEDGRNHCAAVFVHTKPAARRS